MLNVESITSLPRIDDIYALYVAINTKHNKILINRHLLKEYFNTYNTYFDITSLAPAENCA